MQARQLGRRDRRPAADAASARAPCSTTGPMAMPGDQRGAREHARHGGAARPPRRRPRRRPRPAPRPAASPRSPALHLLVGVAARRAVLHREHAQRPPGAAHRHGQHGGERLLAGLRPIGEGRDGSARPAGSSPAPVAAHRPTMPSPTRSRVRPTASGFSPSVATSSRIRPAAGVDRADLARPARRRPDAPARCSGARRRRAIVSRSAGEQAAGGAHAGRSGRAALKRRPPRGERRDGLSDQLRR